MSKQNVALTVAIPTLNRGPYLVATIQQLLQLPLPPGEIIVVDQTRQYSMDIQVQLRKWNDDSVIRWIRLSTPNLVGAMNIALQTASFETIVFLDDDVEIDPALLDSHALCHREKKFSIVAGQVIQPWEQPLTASDSAYRNGATSDPDAFCFNASVPQEIKRVMAGNMSLDQKAVLTIGGFDENFKGAAYRFEAEFAQRAIEKGERIYFQPTASLRHIKANTGGTSSYGKHYQTLSPKHAVGDYYYLLRSKGVPHRGRKFFQRPFRSIATRFHVKHFWWIPVTLCAEIGGMIWALALYFRGPKYVTVSND